jgi:hypothetical protein
MPALRYPEYTPLDDPGAWTSGKITSLDLARTIVNDENDPERKGSNKADGYARTTPETAAPSQADCPISAQLRPNGVMFGWFSLARTTKNHEDTMLELP